MHDRERANIGGIQRKCLSNSTSGRSSIRFAAVRNRSNASLPACRGIKDERTPYPWPDSFGEHKTSRGFGFLIAKKRWPNPMHCGARPLQLGFSFRPRSLTGAAAEKYDITINDQSVVRYLSACPVAAHWREWKSRIRLNNSI